MKIYFAGGGIERPKEGQREREGICNF